MDNEETYFYKGKEYDYKGISRIIGRRVAKDKVNKILERLNKVIVDKKTNEVYYADYRGDVELYRPNEPAKFAKRVDKAVLFNDDIGTIRRGKNVFKVAPLKNPIKRLDGDNLKFLISELSFRYFIDYMGAPVEAQKSLYFEEPRRMNKKDIVETIYRYFRYDNYFEFLGNIGIARNNINLRLVGDDDAEPIMLVKSDKEGASNIDIRNIFFTEANRIYEDEENERREIVKSGQQYYIRKLDPLKLDDFKFYNCEVFEYPNPDKLNCLVNYIKCHFRQKTYYKKFIYSGDEPTLSEFIEFIKANEYQTAYLFNVDGEIIFYQKAKSAPKHSDKYIYKNIYAIIHNNHIYAIKTDANQKVFKKLIKNRYKTDESEFVNTYEQFKSKLEDVITKSKSEPFFIDKNTFINNNVAYTFNEEGNKIKTICDKLKIPVDYSLNKFNLFEKLGDLYNINYSSYYPYDYKQKGYTYFNNKVSNKNAVSIDKNKCYSWCLANLDFIITCDIRFNKSYAYNNEEILDHYLYIIESERSNIFTPDLKMIVSGQYVNFIKNYRCAKFKIVEYIETTRNDNKFKNMINDVYEKLGNVESVSKLIKQALNIYIGKMQRTGTHISQQVKNLKIVSAEAFDYEGALCYEHINDDYIMTWDVETVKQNYFTNNIPLSYQIIEKSRMILINKINELKIKDEDIIQINTDEIVFNNTNKYIKDKSVFTDNFNDWKIKTDVNLFNFDRYAEPKRDLTFALKKLDNKNMILNHYAGGGKSHYIINTLTKKEDIKNDYIILAFTHQSLKPYRKLGLNCMTIDKAILSLHKPPKHIIIDEFGLIKGNHWDYVLDQYYNNDAVIHAFGDNKQLAPAFGNGTISNTFLKYFFNSYNEINYKNYRNKFTVAEYEEMRTRYKDASYTVDLLDKYMTADIDKASAFIAYRNETCDKVNEYIMNKKGFKYDDKKQVASVGLRVVNTQNYLKIDKEEFFNRQTFIIVDNKGENILMYDEDDDEEIKKVYEINKELFFKYFKPHYCMTLYQAQGQTLQNIYYAMEDLTFLFNMPNALYTLISRIKN